MSPAIKKPEAPKKKIIISKKESKIVNILNTNNSNSEASLSKLTDGTIYNTQG